MIWFLRFLCAFIALGWGYAVFRSIRGMRRKRFVLTAADRVASAVPVSIVIPARNEVGNIEDCLRSGLAQDHPEVQVVVLNDASTDGTEEVVRRMAAADERITDLHGDGGALPTGWFGKPWALQRAQKSATGEWLAFVDADVTLQPEAVSRVVGYAQQHQLDMVTGLGNLVMESFWEKVLQPAVGGLILAGNSLSQVNNPEKKDKNLANGQFIVISREAYDRLGGHECVKANILDDIGMARAVVANDMRYHCLDLQALFDCRMYTSLAEIWEGWTKNLFAGMRYSWKNVVLAIVFTLSFSITGHLLLLLGAVGALSTEWLIWGAVITTLCQLLRLIMDIRRGQNIVYGLTHAPANVLVCVMIIHSGLRSMRGTVRWKGRLYQPTDDG